MTNDPIIKIEQLEKSFGDLHVLKGIDLEVNRGEVVCIIGASGSGKSTLLRCINLLEEADSGHIWFDGQDLMDLKVNLNALRQKIGMVFQGFNLFNNKSVLDNCTLAPIAVKHIPKTQAEATAIKHLTTVGLADFIHADSRRLSGGQNHRAGAVHGTGDHALRLTDLRARPRDRRRGAGRHEKPRPAGHDDGRRHARDGVCQGSERPRRLHGSGGYLRAGLAQGGLR